MPPTLLTTALAAALLAAAPAPPASPEADMVLVDAGSFLFGCDDGLAAETPARRLDLPAFLIDRTEVTNRDYRAFLTWVQAHGDDDLRHPAQPAGKDHTPRYWKPFRPRLLRTTGMADLQHFSEEHFRKPDAPVVGVDWFDAWAYAAWAQKRLPTEAEWEKAARGPDGRQWPWGDDWEFERCNSGGYEWKGERDGHIYAAPVGSYPQGASPYGCLDMAGNAWEWVADRFGPHGAAPPADAPSPHHVIKGGGSDSYPSWVRGAARRGFEPTYRHFTLGFRCAKDADTPATRTETETEQGSGR